MSFDADEEILQDFLVEAGEILELLSEQLVELENRPEDKELLNAIFRGFHTVKGGAGFLQLDALVACCHIAENVFDILRKGERPVTSDLMDVVLQALDAVNVMFDQVRNQQDPTPAEPALLDALAALAQPASADVVAEPSPAPVAEPESTPPSVAAVESIASGEGDITDDEFELLLDALHGDTPAASPAVAAPPAAVSTGSDEISDDEFDALLDELHGQGGAPTGAAAKAAASNGDDISDDEFESLLDELHGKGAAPGKEEQSSSGAAKAPAASGPADPDKITDDEFESLLDQLHGHGAAPGKQDAAEQAPVTSTPKAAATPSKPEPKPAAKAATPAPAASAAKTAPAVEAPASTAETTVRVDTARLDEIMNMVGELVLVRNRLVRLGLSSGDEELNKAVGNLDVVTADLQMSVMKTRMQPIKKVFGRFPRVVRDLARSLKKEINLELIGEETDLDKNLVEALADPLVHLVRNSVDHGVELPAEREAAGKPRTGKVVLAAQQEGDHILLTIVDDGRGMDPDVLRAKAVEKGMMDKDAADRLTESECFNLILAPGFSTKTEISDVSGRGVGMDVVKTKISQLNGTINIESTKGQGSRIAIKVPLTLAIMPTLMVMLADQAFALPLVSVNEIYSLDLSRTNVVDGQEVIIVRDKALSLFYLKRWLMPGVEDTSDHSAASVVIVSVGTQRVGFVVDQLVGQEEVVIKPLGRMLQGTAGMAGATITGDGRIALILDIPSLLNRYARRT
ncbi:chemotaxis protein CheA [Pseudomonas neustonica]|uniref:histidine kinase n=1 Tax=Pseudomonas neustonica TaxID=2487346 RepID=A0ABX9XR15_9PSED|nr:MULTISPECIES: chemotaxis protein CheA [Pseudomonas]MAB24569.1 chemotaxis protein CheA [Pseudomonadales bacterium]MBA6419278.1 chemotaxis protein CheA [Pseudomonas sp. 5Ae-yellow]ROZ86886.1 chemotaxis protein CheA [Pseudomonas sp. SSM44]ROZ88498.1 chemotaxis protein CheA [Pseudomonas neustonica]|tara:strand:- start:17674 stop:19905 length:2232 start_codon:yes stop_codon:yes gene_type:complete